MNLYIAQSLYLYCAEVGYDFSVELDSLESPTGAHLVVKGPEEGERQEEEKDCEDLEGKITGEVEGN